MKREDYDEINWIRSKTRFINNDFERLKKIHARLIGGFVDWKCPNCVRSAINQLINYQSKHGKVYERE